MNRTPCLTHINKFHSFHLFSSTAKLNVRKQHSKMYIRSSYCIPRSGGRKKMPWAESKDKQRAHGDVAAKAQRQPVGVAVWSKTLKWLGPVWGSRGFGPSRQKNDWAKALKSDPSGCLQKTRASHAKHRTNTWKTGLERWAGQEVFALHQGGAGRPHGRGRQRPDEGSPAWGAWWRLQASQLGWGG